MPEDPPRVQPRETEGNPPRSGPRNPGRRRYNAQNNAQHQQGLNEDGQPSASNASGQPPSSSRGRRSRGGGPPNSVPRGDGSGNEQQQQRSRNKGNRDQRSQVKGDQEGPPSAPSRGAARNPRRSNFNAQLTSSGPPQASQDSTRATHVAVSYEIPGVRKDDLTSTLTRALGTPPYPDCPICFSAIHPAQPSWSCSPDHPSTRRDTDPEANESTQCCWTTFHLKCIRSWASKSVKDVVEAYRARGEDKGGEWRCPGCQSKRFAVPDGYWCFCGLMRDPKPPRLSTPHSCGNPCTRNRGCGHPCPLSCHPGPCPPCQITLQVSCFCDKQQISYRCGAPPTERILSCGRSCGKLLGCGKHRCESVCHEGSCSPCEQRELVTCYCGKNQREVACGEGDSKECAYRSVAWTGRFTCEQECSRPFDCGLHHCEQSCHPPSRTPPPCPRSPFVVLTCPCGKLSSSSFPKPRTVCTDPVPTCARTCLKPLDGCSHVCGIPCHEGPCPPCTTSITIPCRCSTTTRAVRCSNLNGPNATISENDILCDKPCAALRACGRHQCNRLCCPLAALAKTQKTQKGKGKQRVHQETIVHDPMGWHECDLVCGKLLGCGNHHCEHRDHKPPCPPCLRSSFDEMVCACGQTVLLPPIPCGTRIHCPYLCARPDPPCGHPKSNHTCHDDDAPCPPCPFLASKVCACGKTSIDNVRCSQEKVSCGTPCGKLLSCGFHRCEKLCHGDACGPCQSVCGKSRKLCLPNHHPCTHPCHAPSTCPESEPCRTQIMLTCPCGRLSQPATCGKSSANPQGKEGSGQGQLRCANSCLVAQRNARLADALGISQDAKDRSAEKAVLYSLDLTSYARSNPPFCALVEKTFTEFVKSEKRSQILPHMPEAKRKFVHDLANIYRIDTSMVDQEPHRSVQLIRRVDTRIPTPLLSASIPTTPSLGKLADMRSSHHSSTSPKTNPTPPHLPSPTVPSSLGEKTVPLPQSTNTQSRGWRAVVTGSKASPAPVSAWGPPTPTSSTATATPLISRGASPAPRVVHAPAPAPVPSFVQDIPDDWEADA